MKHTRALFLVMSITCLSPSAAAETIWERARSLDRTEEKRMRASIENVLLGVGDESDLLKARVGLITLSRGEIQDPRTIVLLLRLRREMGLTTSRFSTELLSQALKSDLSLSARAFAELELAHDHLSRGQTSAALAALDRGLEVAWRTQVRAETLILRGLLRLRLGNSDSSLEDFHAVTELEASRRLIVQAYIGQAFAFALRGDAQKTAAFARRAYVTEATRATVSRLDPFWDVKLSALEHESARALLLLGGADALGTREPREAHHARSEACALLRSPDPERLDPTPLESTGAAPAIDRTWGVLIKRALAAFYRDECSRPAPPETDASDASGQSSSRQ